MGLFTGRREQKEAEQRRQQESAASYQRVAPLEAEFKAGFTAWVTNLEEVRVRLGGPPLSNETLRQAGEMPVPQTAGLMQHHAIEVNSYASSFANAFLERRRAEATTAGNRQFYGDVAQFVRSVL